LWSDVASHWPQTVDVSVCSLPADFIDEYRHCSADINLVEEGSKEAPNPLEKACNTVPIFTNHHRFYLSIFSVLFKLS
jgi:hypothetical protein